MGGGPESQGVYVGKVHAAPTTLPPTVNTEALQLFDVAYARLQVPFCFCRQTADDFLSDARYAVRIEHIAGWCRRETVQPE